MLPEPSCIRLIWLLVRKDLHLVQENRKAKILRVPSLVAFGMGNWHIEPRGLIGYISDNTRDKTMKSRLTSSMGLGAF